MVRLPGATSGGRLAEVLADMIEVTQKGPLSTEDLPALQTDPIRSVTNGVNVAVQSPSRLPRAMAPASARFFHAAEGGRVAGRGAVLGLCRHQSHFFPVAGAFASARSRSQCADHGAVGLGNDLGRTLRRQQPKRLRKIGR